VLRRAGLRQGLTVLHYVLIALSAWAAAVVVLKLTSLDLTPRAQPKASVEAENLVASRGRRAGDDNVILKRNLFGATDLDVDTVEAPAAGESDLKLRGVASSEGSDFAVFENISSGEQNVFAVGEKIFDGPRLVSVDAEGADVLLRGRKRRYEIEEDQPGEPDKRERGAKSAKKGDTPGVKKTGEGAYLVDRREVEHAVSNLNEVITQARAVPVLQDGKSAGFKLFSIRPNSIFQKIGLVDGDIVQRVNDTELTDPSKAVGLLEEIQSMDQVRVNFMRSGKQQTFTYTIR
jgi:general secretion pathway protein C